MANLSAKIETQMVEASDEGNIDGSSEDLSHQKKDSVQPSGIMGGVQFADAAMGGVLMNGVLLFENGLVLSEKEPFPSHSHSVDHRVGLRPRASLDSLNTSYEFLIFFPCWKQVL